jgi:hypothetical protein
MEFEKLGPKTVFDGEKFCRKYFLIRPLGGAVSSGKSFLFKIKANVYRYFSSIVFFSDSECFPVKFDLAVSFPGSKVTFEQFYSSTNQQPAKF